ncbi:hypothetical protein, partial [Phocaeicola vulgatus]|uniref:hypothetical protein n=1 Tax=Phocaeicola vulgatus TaxID=821 RepID=UPI001E406842
HSLHFTFAFGLYKGHYTYPMVAQFSTGILAHFSISIYKDKTARRFKRKSGKLELRRRLRDAYAMLTHSVHSRTLRKGFTRAIA